MTRASPPLSNQSPRRRRRSPAGAGAAGGAPHADRLATGHLLPDESGECSPIRSAESGDLAGRRALYWPMEVVLAGATTAALTQPPMRSSSAVSAAAADSACPNPGTIHSSFGSFSAPFSCVGGSTGE